MTKFGHLRDPAALRRELGHPIIDSDSHYTEFAPLFDEQFTETVKQLAGKELRDEIVAAPNLRMYLLARTTPIGQAFGSSRWIAESPEERRANGTPMPGWGPPHTNALDRATTLLPSLRAERLEEIGIDYSVLYPSSALVFPHIDPTELRQVACRALNILNAATYRDFRDQMTPVAVIPMTTPEEAIAELDYAVIELGLKVAMVGPIARPIPNVHRAHPELFQTAFRLDSFGIDSEHDYDPFWARCAELKVPLAVHSTSCATGFRRSPSNYTFNHAGNFGEASDIFCRSVFLGGVTRRFPTLKFQFLEGGSGWACMLYAELVHRWEKRNIEALRAHLKAAQTSGPEFVRLLEKYGGPAVRDKLKDAPHAIVYQLGTETPPDDFARCEIESVEDIEELFVPRFFFGCEADDPTIAWAFNTAVNPGGARLRATLGSDMGHWDVPDIRGIVPEAFELVERGLISRADFRRFAFEHPCELFAGVNPGFFAGTKVEPYLAEAAQ
jgi:predicted TIM-barrel fold metal-dependent hydrolase